jgi:hypothetical protein
MIIELLTQTGFVQGVDYSYENGVLTALQRTRLVDQEIDHEEIPEVLGAEGDVIEPAVPAWTEVIQVEETYTVQIPSLEELKREIVSQNDPALIISEYLKGKPVSDEDSLNIDLFLAGQGGWRFQNIPVPSGDELFDLIDTTKTKADQQKVNTESLQFLNSTDFMVLRHIRQKALGETTTLTEEAYLELEQKRSEAASRIIK